MEKQKGIMKKIIIVEANKQCYNVIKKQKNEGKSAFIDAIIKGAKKKECRNIALELST